MQVSTWNLTVLTCPRGSRVVGFMQELVIYSSPGDEADDVVGDAALACALHWPDHELLRVFRCIAVSRGDELTPVSS